MNKKLVYTSLFASIALGFFSSTVISAPPSAEMQVQAEVTADTLSIAHRADMSFGVFSSPVNETTIVLSTDPSVSRVANPAGSNIFLLGSGSPGRINVGGFIGGTVNLDIPASVPLNDGGAGSMSLGDITLRLDGEATDLAGTSFEMTGPAGESSSDIDIFLGGTLTVPSGAPVGSYTGTFTITVSY